MNIHFFIPGNQEDPKGNPIPYHRTTQKSLWDKQAKRYAAWKKYVQQCALEAGLDIRKLQKNQTYSLDVMCWFTDETHGDPENVRKGVQDALFEIAGDKHVFGAVYFAHIPGLTESHNPGVEISLAGK